MSLPELFANVPVPGTAAPLTTLFGNQGTLSPGSVTLRVKAAAPSVLQGAGQFRVLVDQEYMTVTGGASATTWNVTRGVESSTQASHNDGTPVYHVFTAGAMSGMAQKGSDGYLGTPGYGGTQMSPSAGVVTQYVAPSGDQTGSTDLTNLTSAIGVGGTILLGKGDFYVGAAGYSTPVVASAGTRLTGMGDSTVVHTDTTLRFGSNSEVDHIRFNTRTSLARDGNNIATVNNVAALVQFANCSDCKVHDISGDGLAIQFLNCAGFGCWANYFAAGNTGIQGSSSSVRGRIWGNRVNGSFANGISINNCSDITIVDNDSNTNGQAGIALKNGSTRINVMDNRCRGNTADGIDANASNMNVACYFVIGVNSCEGNSATGVYCPGSYNTIVGNRCTGNSTYGVLVKAYQSDVTTATNIVCVDNNCTGNASGQESLQNCDVGTTASTSALDWVTIGQGSYPMATGSAGVIWNPGPQDVYQNGVLVSSDLATSSISISNAGVITFSVAAGSYWIKNSAGVLIRNTAVAQNSQTITPSLPPSGKYAVVGLEIDMVGNLTMTKGNDTSTQLNTGQLIASNTPATSSAKLRISDFAVFNSSGTYQFGDTTQTATQGVTWIDRRPWARRATCQGPSSGAAQTPTTGSWQLVTGTAQRVETVSGRVMFQVVASLYAASTGVQPIALAIGWDGSAQQGLASTQYVGGTTATLTVTGGGQMIAVPAGSHLFQLFTQSASAYSVAFSQFSMREVTSSNNNGTA